MNRYIPLYAVQLAMGAIRPPEEEKEGFYERSKIDTCNIVDRIAKSARLYIRSDIALETRKC